MRVNFGILHGCALPLSAYVSTDENWGERAVVVVLLCFAISVSWRLA